MSKYISKFKSPYQEVIGTAPVNQVFADAGGNSNNVTYKNVQILTLDGISSFVDTGMKIQGGTPIYIEVKCTLNSSIFQNIVSCGGAADKKGFYIAYQEGRGLHVRIADGDESNYITSVITPDVGNQIHIIFEYSGINGDNGNLTINGTTFTLPLISWAGDSFYNLVVGADNGGTVRYWTGSISYFKYNDNIEYNFQDGDDDLIIDVSGNGNHGILTGAILSEARGTRADGIDSVLIKNGYSLFKQIADPTKFICAAYTEAGVPTKTSIVGYESPIEIPKNVISDNKITYSGILNAGISEIDATFEDIDNIEIIPKEDFSINNAGDVITDWVLQPYQAKYYSDGAQAFTVDGKEEWVIKTFE